MSATLATPSNEGGNNVIKSIAGQNTVSQSYWGNHQLVILLNQNVLDPTIGLLFNPVALLPAVNIIQTAYWTPSFFSLVNETELTPVLLGANTQVTILGFP